MQLMVFLGALGLVILIWILVLACLITGIAFLYDLLKP
jgi:hypothetical protein